MLLPDGRRLENTGPPASAVATRSGVRRRREPGRPESYTIGGVNVERLPIAPGFPAPPSRGRTGLVLTGGGARSAYQVGVMRAVADLLPRDAPTPFHVITGTSAGAIVAANIATYAAHYRTGAVALERVWRNFHVDQVFRTDTPSMLRAGVRWMAALLSVGRLASPPDSMFDNTPLRQLLERRIDFGRMRAALATGHLEALVISAAGYSSAQSFAFYESRVRPAGDAPSWPRGVAAELELDHLMASSAVPFLFPPVRMHGEYFGDGAMRQVTPLSPAIRLGADRLFVVGVRDNRKQAPLTARAASTPSFGQLFGFMLDTLFMDSLHAGVAQLERLNRLLAQSVVPNPEGLRHIDSLVIVPGADLGAIAARHARQMPRTVRALLRVMGAANSDGSQLLSYLLFESGYTRELIKLGYADTMARREELSAFLEPGVRQGAGAAVSAR
jgi:NTE family protein